MRNKKHNSKLNRLKNKEQEDKKKQKVIINSMKHYPKFSKDSENSKKKAEFERKKLEEENRKKGRND